MPISDVVYSFIGNAARRAARLTHRFGKDRRGASAVEFAIVAVPFFALVMAIIEAAMAFFASQVMETGLRDAARMIRTGQAQNGSWTRDRFKQEVCDNIPALLSCGSLTIDVRSYQSFGAADWSTPMSDGNFNPAAAQFNMGNPGSIVVARAYYSWPSFANIIGSSLANQANGTILLVASSAFRNEPFQQN
jgi:Flp pilus assembly protein TadG